MSQDTPGVDEKEGERGTGERGTQYLIDNELSMMSPLMSP